MKFVRIGVVLVVACAALVTGCGTKPDAPSSAPAGSASAATGEDFNSIDVMFAQMMVPHNRRGVEIARLAKDRPVRAEVKTMAIAIEATQNEEIEMMSGWLRKWKQPATADPSAHAAHAGHGGVVPERTEAEINALRDTPDAEFERKFINLLIANQDDAIQLASMETSGGVNEAAKEFANKVKLSRNGEISLLRGYLGS
ncbi:DUF305 domain-containing protein [Dactylosporangium sp. NPDC000521]|uniref:DUF305 domain-containing protein n=1 Tax=Dactylosporangium sp. NPDC000521 TaxID=3363975 RepID=UPI0036A0DA8C